ncbi:HNH endonuclease [Nonomuraea bangladeshensis]|uniref:HNH endonuclease n=1 Tax=Nonomuraea bangladeshensis TaxID=404385 RepID=A0ABV3H1Q2_9ACTN
MDQEEARQPVKRPAGTQGSTREWRAMRLEVLRRAGGIGKARCYLCGTLVTDHDEKLPTHYHCEHIVPKVSGGKTEYSNLAVSCRMCNGQKSLIDAGSSALAKRQTRVQQRCEFHGERCGTLHSEVGAELYDIMFG